jgi:hypothetical protein
MTELTDEQISKEFESRAAAAPVHFRKAIEGCDEWDRERLIATVKDLATAQDIELFYKNIDKQTIQNLTSIGKGFESQLNNVRKTLLMASKMFALVTANLTMFLDEETRLNLRSMNADVDSMLSVSNPVVPWPDDASAVKMPDGRVK